MKPLSLQFDPSGYVCSVLLVVYLWLEEAICVCYMYDQKSLAPSQSKPYHSLDVPFFITSRKFCEIKLQNQGFPGSAATLSYFYEILFIQ